MRLRRYPFVRHGAAAFALFCLAAALAPAARAESRQDVEIPSVTQGQPLRGVLFAPDDGGAKPGVLVLAPGSGRPEPADLRYAAALAKAGFVALAVSYQTNTTKNSRWSPRITTELAGVTDWLRARPEVGGRPVGTVGFSAGSQGLLLGAKHGAVRAMVVYYGGYNLRKYAKGGQNIPAHLPLPIDAAAQVKGAVLLLHGEKDDEISFKDAEEMRDALKAAGKTVELIVYPGAYHRFDRGNVEGKAGDIGATGFTYREDPAVAKDAFQRTIVWLAKYLAGPTGASANPAPANSAAQDDEPIGPTGRTPSQAISASDRDGDGKLSKAEFKGPPAAFGNIDKNGDGFLTKDELIAAWRH